MATRLLRPIDPARDLGSSSLDDPINTTPLATPARRDVSEHAPAAASQSASAPFVQGVPAPASSAPRELDLAGFAELPGRNGVWVYDSPVPVPAPVPR
jgi:hypothetical protein